MREKKRIYIAHWCLREIRARFICNISENQDQTITCQDTCRSRKSRSQTLRSYWSAPRRRPLGKGNAGSRNVLSPPGSASVSFFVDVICLKNKLSLKINYRKIPKISPRAYIFQRPFLRGLFLKGLIYGGKFAFQNRLG